MMHFDRITLRITRTSTFPFLQQPSKATGDPSLKILHYCSHELTAVESYRHDVLYPYLHYHCNISDTDCLLHTHGDHLEEARCYMELVGIVSIYDCGLGLWGYTRAYRRKSLR